MSATARVLYEEDAASLDASNIRHGVYSISNEAYHAGPGISKSQLDFVHESPAVYQWSLNAPRSFSAAASEGTAIHTLLLEPESFNVRYAVGPDCDRRSNANKERWTEFEATLNGREAISLEDRDKLFEMRDSVMAHPEAAGLLALPGESEQSVYWVDDQTGMLCRCRPDRWARRHRIVIDIKSTDDIAKFHWSARDYRYAVQQAFYTDGIEAETGHQLSAFVFIVIGKRREMGRYPVRVFEIPSHTIDMAREEYREDLKTISTCMQTGVWPGIQPLIIPPTYN